MVRNIRHLLANSMDEYTRLDVDGKQSLLRNVTGPHTFLNIKLLGPTRTRTAYGHIKYRLGILTVTATEEH